MSPQRQRVVNASAETVALFDLNDQQCGEIELRPRGKNAPPRNVVWMGRKFREGDGSGFYGPGQFAEVPR